MIARMGMRAKFIPFRLSASFLGQWQKLFAEHTDDETETLYDEHTKHAHNKTALTLFNSFFVVWSKINLDEITFEARYFEGRDHTEK